MMARYEFHTKGIDAFIKALGNLNRRLKEEGSDKTIVTFYGFPHRQQELEMT